MIKAIPLLVSLLTVFTAGSLPLKDVGNELIKTDEQQQVMLAGRAETDVSVKPFEKEPRAGKNVQSDKNYTISDSADGKSDSAKNDATAPETKKSVNTENPAGRKNAADNNSAERRRTAPYSTPTQFSNTVRRSLTNVTKRCLR